MEESLPYKAEYAKSSRALCKSCKSTIGKDTFRLAVMVQSPMFDGKVPHWYHMMCFFGKQRPKSVGDIEHYELLRYDDQQKIKEKIESFGAGSVVVPEKKGKKRAGESASNNGALKDFLVEYSKSSRATCRGCEQKIMKDEEFDDLDVSHMVEPFDLSNKASLINIVIQLVNSSVALIQLYKDIQIHQNDDLEKHARLSNDVHQSMKTIESLRKDIANKDKQLLMDKEQSCLNRLENTELKNKVDLAEKEITLMQKESIAEKVRHEHEIQKVLAESKRLENKFTKNCGEYISQEGQDVSVIDNYKKNEENHLKIISQLQKNNHELLEEILALKGELCTSNFL